MGGRFFLYLLCYPLPMIEIKLIEDPATIDLRPAPFAVVGWFIPSLSNGEWGYEVIRSRNEEIPIMKFPDDDYIQYPDGTFIGAYAEGKLVGLALLLPGDFAYMYLADLEVDLDYREQGVGSLLMQKASEVARKEGYSGIYTYAQDNNVAACLFYLHNGFRIGGFDNELYRHTPQEGKGDITFYWDF